MYGKKYIQIFFIIKKHAIMSYKRYNIREINKQLKYHDYFTRGKKNSQDTLGSVQKKLLKIFLSGEVIPNFPYKYLSKVILIGVFNVLRR